MSKKMEGIEVYLCGVDYQHEVGHASGGNVVYPSKEDLIRHRGCVSECGIVKARVVLEEWVLEQNLFEKKAPKLDRPTTQEKLHKDYFEYMRVTATKPHHEMTPEVAYLLKQIALMQEQHEVEIGRLRNYIEKVETRLYKTREEMKAAGKEKGDA